MRWKTTVITLLLTSGAVWNACAAESDDSDSYFPIWGDEARARGYSIPLPFGVNLSYMNMRQDIMVDSITFSGLKLGNHPIPSDMFAMMPDTRGRRAKPRIFVSICGYFRSLMSTGF